MMLAMMVDTCTANNDTLDKIREKKARLVKKLKKDFRKLKKQEGAVKLVGSENGGHEGNDSIVPFSRQKKFSKKFFRPTLKIIR